MKGKIKYILLMVLIILAIIGAYIIANPKTQVTEEKEAFQINKITLYSSANAVSNEGLEKNWELDIYQYTDIAIYVEKLENKEIERIYIDNISISEKPQLGQANVYKKELEDFAKAMQLEKFAEIIEFEVAEKGEFLQNCVNPITISYVNNVKQDYPITNINDKLEYNASVLKRAKILTSEIKAQISFDVNIVDSENIKHTCNVQLEVPVEELMNGQNTVEKSENIKLKRTE